MGDRAIAELRTDRGSLFFYTHWRGRDLYKMCVDALAVAKPRHGDTAYALRWVVDQLIASSGARDNEVGAGLMLSPDAEDEYNNDKPSVFVDLETWTVTDLGGRDLAGEVV